MYDMLMKNKPISPFFFDETYLAMRENNALCHVPVVTIFQLDGAPPHFFYSACVFLNREFPDYWIGRGGPISCPLIPYI
jgi:hypothetical protein